MFVLYPFDTISSTMDEALKLYKNGVKPGAVIICAEQTHGRGRFNRVWESEKGNLFSSLTWHANPENIAFYTFVIAYAMVDALMEYGIFPSIKWPNDVLLDGKKIGGVLIEVCGHDNESVDIIIGFGMNLLHAPDNTTYPATSVYDSTQLKIDPQDLLVKILDHFKKYDAILKNQGFEPFRQNFKTLNHFKDKDMTIHVGLNQITGSFYTLSDRGELVLELIDGSTQTFSSGDVFLKETQ